MTPTRGRTRWGVVTAIVLPFLLVLAPMTAAALFLVASGVIEDEVSCGQALGFGRAELPDGATDAKCLADDGLMDEGYTASFRMPVTEVVPWLEATCPSGECPEVPPDRQGGISVQLDYTDLDVWEPEHSHYVDITVGPPGGDGTVRVEFAAYNV